MSLSIEVDFRSCATERDVHIESIKRLPVLKKDIEGIEDLQDGPRSMVEDFFTGKTYPTDGECSITFPNPYGGFLTLYGDVESDLTIVWHETSVQSQGRIEALAVSSENAKYTEFDPRLQRQNSSEGIKAIDDIDKFRVRRLGGSYANPLL